MRIKLKINNSKLLIEKHSWGIGDGIGGTEVRVGIVKSKEDCYAICRTRTKNGVLANGATVDTKTGTNCYCEFGMKKRNTVKKWSSAFIIRCKFLFGSFIIIIFIIRVKASECG